MFSSRIILIGSACLLAGVIAGWSVRDGAERIIENWNANDGWASVETADFTLSYPKYMTTQEAQEPYFFLSDLEMLFFTEKSSYQVENYRQDAWLVISTQNFEKEDCYAPTRDGFVTFDKIVTINGREFVYATFAGVAAGNTYDSTLYRTHANGVCYELTTTLHTASDWIDVDRGRTADAQAELTNDLKQAVETFVIE